jgi:putative sigma-54 modulation protein
MRIQIRGPKSDVSQRLRGHVERRIGLALGRFAPRIGRVLVQFSPVGTERRCHIEVSLSAQSVLAEDVHADPFAALDNAATRLSRFIARAIERELAWDQAPRSVQAKPRRSRR